MRVGWGTTMSGVLACIEVYKLHIDSYFRYSDASNLHLARTKLVNLSVLLGESSGVLDRDDWSNASDYDLNGA